jgi:spore coat polysaccharide biosynthesis protein SpsF
MNSNRRLVATIACRNQGSRLYGKPLQNLDVKRGVRIIDNIIACLKSIKCIDEVALAISAGVENEVFKRVADELSLRYVVGDEHDVLGRLVECGRFTGATDVFRVTSESPFPYFEQMERAWEEYCREGADAYFLDDIIDGSNFEIISMRALALSHEKGEARHRSELCTLYLRENAQDFKIIKAQPPEALIRRDLRLTVDNPEDLALCRSIYGVLKDKAPRIPVAGIVSFLDANPKLIELTAPFTEAGYATMYVWGKK